MTVLIWLPVAVFVAVAMDLWAAFLHGRVWHRWLWRIHASHHRRRAGRFEANDVLSALHAPLAIACILYGCKASPGIAREVVFGVGIGASAFGIAYAIVHDGLVHRRLPGAGALARFRFLHDIAAAHRVHHVGERGGAPYGLFFGPLELRWSKRRALTHRASPTTAPPPPPSAQSSSPPSPAAPRPTR